MSLFLAPIHFWLFNKVKIQEDLEKSVYEAFKSEYGDSVNSLYEESIKSYGKPFYIENESLENIIDTSNIHGWLQSAISTAELRLSYFIKLLLEKYREDSLMLLETTFKESGAKYGSLSKEKLGSVNGKSIYDALYDNIIDGMPCDNVRTVTISEDNCTEYCQNICLHKGYWEETGLDSEIAYELRSSWIKSFVNTISDGEFEYNFDNGSKQIHKISKK